MRKYMHCTTALELARKLIYYSRCFFLETKRRRTHVTAKICRQREKVSVIRRALTDIKALIIRAILQLTARFAGIHATA